MSKKINNHATRDPGKSIQSKSDVSELKGPQATQEQLRIAQILNKDEDAELRAKVSQVRDITACSEECAMMALHDSSYEVSAAINTVYEQLGDSQSEWQVTTKRHSKKGPSDSGDTPVLFDVQNDSWGETHEEPPFVPVETSGEGTGGISEILSGSRGRGGRRRDRGGGEKSNRGGTDGSRQRRRDKRNINDSSGQDNGFITSEGDAHGENFEKVEMVTSIDSAILEQGPFSESTDRGKRKTLERGNGRFSSRSRGRGRRGRGDHNSSAEHGQSAWCDEDTPSDHLYRDRFDGDGFTNQNRKGRFDRDSFEEQTRRRRFDHDISGEQVHRGRFDNDISGDYMRRGRFDNDHKNDTSDGSWRRKDDGGEFRGRSWRGGRGGGKGSMMTGSNRRGRGHQDSFSNRPRHQNGGMEIDTWTNEQARGDRLPEVERWDDAGDLEGDWTGDSIVVTNSNAIDLDKILNKDVSNSLPEDSAILFESSSQTKTVKEPVVSTSETKQARDAYNRMATESIKSAIGISNKTDVSLASCYEAIFGQKQSTTKPPPPSTQIPDAPVQLAPTLQTSQGRLTCQFGFGSQGFIIPPGQTSPQIPSSSVASTSSHNQYHSVPTSLQNTNMEASTPHQSIPNSTQHSVTEHSSFVDSTTTSSSPHERNQVPLSVQQSPPNQQPQSNMYESVSSLSQQHRPQHTIVSPEKNTHSNNAFTSSYQPTQSSSLQNVTSNSSYSSPAKPQIANSCGGFGSSVQTSYSSNSYQNYPSQSNADISESVSKLSMSSDQSKDTPHASNTGSSFSHHSKPLFQPQQQLTAPQQLQQQLQQQMKNTGSSFSANTAQGNTASSGSSNYQQPIPPGISMPPMLPYMNFPVDYEAQQRLFLELQQQQHNMSSATSTDPSGTGVSKAGLVGGQRFDLQSPLSTSTGTPAGMQLPHQGTLPPYMFNLYYQMYPHHFLQNNLGSFLQANQSHNQSHMPGAAINPAQYTAAAKAVPPFSNFGSVSMHDEMDMNKFSAGITNKPSHIKQSGSTTYHSGGIPQSNESKPVGGGASISSTNNVPSHMNAVGGGGAGSGYPANFPNPFAHYMAMPQTGGSAGMMHHSQESAGGRMMNPVSGGASKQPNMGKYYNWGNN